jgi:hypothetical protein
VNLVNVDEGLYCELVRVPYLCCSNEFLFIYKVFRGFHLLKGRAPRKCTMFTSSRKCTTLTKYQTMRNRLLLCFSAYWHGGKNNPAAGGFVGFGLVWADAVDLSINRKKNRKAFDVEYNTMLYMLHGRKTKTKTIDTRRGPKEKPHCCSCEGRRTGGFGADRREGKPASVLFCSRRNKTCDRKTIEKITRMERDWQLLEQQPAPNQAFLLRGTHGY